MSDGLKTVSDVAFGLIEDRSKEATQCSNCGKPLDTNSIRYINGTGFCCDECDKIYSNREQYGVGIHDALERYILPVYKNTDINILKNNLSKPELVDRILNWQMGSQGLAIIGDTGCGKTRILTALMKRLIKIDLVGVDKTLMVFYAGELERAIISSFSNKSKAYDDLMRQLENCSLLIIDDFGKEKFTERYEVSIFQIFEKRTANLRPTIFTTNFRGVDLRARFSDQNNYEPFSRRLNEFCDRILLSKK